MPTHNLDTQRGTDNGKHAGGRPRKGSLVYGPQHGWAARVMVDVDGERVRRTIRLGTHDRAAARRKLARLLASPDAATAAVEATRVETLSSYAEDWLRHRKAIGVRSVKAERLWVESYWAPELGKRPLDKITAGDVRDVLRTLAESGRLHGSSFSNMRGTLKRLLGAAKIDGIVAENVAADVTLRGLVPADVVKARAVLTDDEIRRLLASERATPEVKMAVLLSRTIGGMRSGDLVALDWTHFGPGFSTCAVPRRKTRGKRGAQTLDVPEQVRPLLDAWHKAHGSRTSGPVFPVRSGKRAGQRKADGNSWAWRLRRDLWLAGVVRHDCTRPLCMKPPRWKKKKGEPLQPCCENGRHDPLYWEMEDTLPVDFHSTRRSYCTALAAANVATTVAQVLAGHSDPSVHGRYVAAATIRELPAGAMLDLSDTAEVLAESLPELPGPANETELQATGTVGAPGVSRTRDQRFRKLGDGTTLLELPGEFDDSQGSAPACLDTIHHARQNSAPKLPSPADWLRPRQRSLAEMASQVVRSVNGRSRFARRHAATLARAVLDALAAPRMPHSEPLAPSYLPAMAGLCEAVAALPGAAERLPELAAFLN